jgi:hypothetical protein
MELDSGVGPADFEVHARVFHMTLTAGLYRVMHADIVGIATHDAHIAHAKTHVKQATGYEIARLIVTLFVIPMIRSRTKRHHEKKNKNYLVDRSQANGRPSGHKTPPDRAGTY